MATVVREGVVHVLDRRGEPDRWSQLMSALGAVRERRGPRDVARNHDKYLAEIYAGRRRLR